MAEQQAWEFTNTASSRENNNEKPSSLNLGGSKEQIRVPSKVQVLTVKSYNIHQITEGVLK